MTQDTPMLERFRGATAVVTGAGSGIGRATALQLGTLGLTVACVDVRGDLAEETAALVERSEGAAYGLGVDVVDVDAMRAAADRVIERSGVPRLVVAAAGVSLRPLRPIWENSLADWQWVMGVNFWGVVNTVSAFLPSQIALSGPRHVVAVNSMSQFRGLSGHAVYITSKRAAEGYMECLAADGASHDLDVTIVYPGRVRTSLASSEQLRPPGDRSDARDLTALEIPVASLANNPEIPAEEVAAAIIRGIEDRERYVLTHVPPVDVMVDRLSGILGTDLVPSHRPVPTATVGTSPGGQP